MIEAEWMACEDPDLMFAIFKVSGTDRKLRLFSVACCRHLRSLPWGADYIPHPAWTDDRETDEKGRAAVLVAERYADQFATAAELEEVYGDMSWACADANQNHPVYGACFNVTVPRAVDGVVGCSHYAANAALSWSAWHDEDGDELTCWPGWLEEVSECRYQAALVRDIFGNPFRPVAFSPEWRTDTAVALARQMYESRNFSAMPILADALQDAGCDSEDILKHCRDAKQTHVRGCWVVDLVLGKE